VARRHLAASDYSAALTCLAGLRAPVDAFFDGVLVNVEDDELRNNRLNLLKTLQALFLQVADISQLVVGK
jgi:glycyl-tRNA synthetase beta chain